MTGYAVQAQYAAFRDINIHHTGCQPDVYLVATLVVISLVVICFVFWKTKGLFSRIALIERAIDTAVNLHDTPAIQKENHSLQKAN